ncbi:alpha/beta fold hydrolase [Hydrogenophaga electricum]|uniref:Esterase n=1 Tax=Hydrogenophaga electricum TaxID=1230953 RepID=A0ABQ6C134_9BURK|nr:alpha/beta fold hydrolase [Hydrogenophaga electricum]GLS14088.1 esterase [Hydrogenophaga electricum]
MLQLHSIRSYHIGGERRALQGRPVEQRVLAQGSAPRPIDMNGDHMVGQMYVQHYRQVAPVRPWPVVLWHGGGMTGANWETTPDGRDGWLQQWLAAGFDVIVTDAMERGRSSWAPWPELYTTAPISRSLQEGWEMFRIGPAAGYASAPQARRAHPGQQFPVDAFDQFACQWVPRWTGHDEPIMAAYGQLLDQVGPCLLVGHSQGGGFALRAAAQWPDRVKAVVALEPSGAPALQGASAGLRQVPHLVVWGDFFDQHPQWQRYRATVDAYTQGLQAQGVPVTPLVLAEHGLPGHSHFPMLDRQSDAVGRLVAHWLLDSASR